MEHKSSPIDIQASEEQEYVETKNIKRKPRAAAAAAAAHQTKTHNPATRPKSSTSAKPSWNSPQVLNENEEFQKSEFSSKTKIQHVLRELKEDIVPLNRRRHSSPSKWETMIENLQQESLNDRSGAAGEDKHFYHQVDRDQVGAHIYSNKWTRFINANKSLNSFSSKTKAELQAGSSKTKAELQQASKVKSRNTQNKPKNSLSPLCCLFKLRDFAVGPLLGLLLWPALYEFVGWLIISLGGWVASLTTLYVANWISNVNGESILVKGPTFWTIYSLLTTFLILIVAIGFMIIDLKPQKITQHIRRQLLYSIPILILLVSHYLNKAFEYQKIECKEYLKNKEMVHLSYNCDKYRMMNGIGDVETNFGILITNSLSCLAVFGIYSFIYYKRNVN